MKMPLLELSMRQAWEEDNYTEWLDILKQFAREIIDVEKIIRERLVLRERWELWEVYKAAKSRQVTFQESEKVTQCEDLETEILQKVSQQQQQRAQCFRRDMEAMQRVGDDQTARVEKAELMPSRYQAELMRARRTVRLQIRGNAHNPHEVLAAVNLPIAAPSKVKCAHPYYKGTRSLRPVQYDNIPVTLCVEVVWGLSGF